LQRPISMIRVIWCRWLQWK